MTAINSELQGIHWQEPLCDLAVDQSWASFKSILENVQWKYIPVRRRLGKRSKSIWMTNYALKAVRHKRQVYTKYIHTNHPACINAARTACSLVKQNRRNFEV